MTNKCKVQGSEIVEQCENSIAAHDARAAIDAALAEINAAMPAPPLDFATDHASHITKITGGPIAARPVD